MLSFWRQWNWTRAARRIRLDPSAKAAFRARLETHVRERPVRIPADERLLFRNAFFLNPTRLMPVFIIVALVALLGGGTSLAAENTVPGDALYGVKVGINERVVAVLSLSDAAKTDWEVRLAERRVQEATELAAKDALKPDVAQRIEENFAEHAVRVQERITALTEKGDEEDAADLASRFEGSLRAHDRVLAQLKERERSLPGDGQEQELASLSDDVQKELKHASDDREKLEKSIADEDVKKTDETKTEDRKTAAEGKLKAAANVLSSATRFVANKKDKTGAEAVKSAEEGLKKAAELITQGTAKLATNEFGDAFVLGNQAIRAAQEAKTLVERSEHLDLDIKGGLDENEDEDEDATDDDGDNEDLNESEKKSAERVREDAKDAAERVREQDKDAAERMEEAAKQVEEARRESEKESD